MLKIISDLLFPPRDSESIVSNLTSAEHTRLYTPHMVNKIVCLTKYQDRVVRAIITENKFHRNKIATAVLANWLKTWLNNKPDCVLIAVPLSPERKRMRGYDQVAEIIRLVPNVGSAPLLRRTRHTQPQTSLDKEARLQNMHDAFKINQSIDVAPLEHKTVVLIDDVMTTGATINAARATLAPHLPASTKIIRLALAH